MFEYLRLEVDPNFRYEAGNFWLGCNEPAAAGNLGNFPDPVLCWLRTVLGPEKLYFQ